MKKNWKRIVAILCSISLLAGVAWAGIPEKTVEASEGATGQTSEAVDVTTEDIPEGYKWLTASDFHYAAIALSGTFEQNDGNYIHDLNSTLDKTVITAKVNFPSSGTNRIYIGKGWCGISFWGTGDTIEMYKDAGTHVTTFTEEIAGCQLTNNAELEISISFEYVNKSGTNTDIKVGVFFNGNLYDNKYITVSSFDVTTLSQTIHLYVQGSSITIRDAQTPVPTYLDDFTTTTIGMDASHKTAEFVGRTNLDGTLFGARVTYTAPSQMFHFGGLGSGWLGLKFCTWGSGTFALEWGQLSTSDTRELKDVAGNEFYDTFDPAIALGEGHSSFLNQEFDLHISTEFINHDNDATLDVRYGVFINGKLYKYYYSYDTAQYMGNYVAMNEAGGGTISFASAGSISGKTISTSKVPIQISANDFVDFGRSYGYSVLDSTDGNSKGGSFQSEYKEAPNLVNTTFGLNTTFTGSTLLFVGGTGGWGGIQIGLSGDNLSISSGILSPVTIASTIVTPDFVDATTFVGRATDIWISTEVANLNSSGAEDDVIFTIYIDGRLYNILHAYDQLSNLGSYVCFQNWDTGSTFSAVHKTTENTAIPEGMVETTFRDFGIANGTYTGTGQLGDYQGDTSDGFSAIMENFMFEGYVQFSSEKQSTLSLLGLTESADARDGIVISNYFDWATINEGELAVNLFSGTRCIKLYPDIAGTQLVDKEIKLTITMQIDADNFSDALVGIYINDKLYNNTVFRVTSLFDVENIDDYRHPRVYRGVDANIRVASAGEDIREELPTDSLTLTPNELGIAGEWNSSNSTFQTLTSNYTTTNEASTVLSLVGKTISMNMKYSGDNYIHLSPSSDTVSDVAANWRGIRIHTIDSNTIDISYSDEAGDKAGITCVSDIAGVDFTKEFNMKLTIELDGTNDVKVAVWFADKLYNHTYVKWEGIADKLVATADVLPQGDGTITLSSPKTYSIPTQEDGYTCVKLTDYISEHTDAGNFVADTKVYSGNSEMGSISGLTADKLVVSGKLVLTVDGHMRLLGNWDGYKVGVDWKDNMVLFTHVTKNFTPISVPLTELANGQFQFDLVHTIVAADGDGKYNDVQVEFWVDGKLADGRSHYYIDIADDITDPDKCRIYPESGSVMLLDKYSYEYEEGNYFNLAQGDYLVLADTVNVNDANAVYTVGDKITRTGDYQIVRTTGAVPTYNYVYIWEAGDVRADETIDMKDLIAAKKVEAGLETAKSAIKAADIDNDGSVDADILRQKLIGSITNLNDVAVDSIYYVIAEDGTPVMPISGFWGPRMISEYTDETELNTIQDKYYNYIAEAGINVINYIEMDAADEEGLVQNLQNLSMAEKYNLGLFVKDSAVDGNLSEQQLANRLSLYGTYRSFLGIHTYDEPKSDDWYADSSNKSIAEIADEAKMLNKYANLSSYINLFPLGDDSNIKNYLNEYLTSCSPKYLTYDYYPNFASTDHHGYFEGLEMARTSGIPFWAYVSAGGNFATGLTSSTNNIAPTRSQFLWNVNTTLAFGAKGIQYFPMVQPPYYSDTVDGEGSRVSQDFGRNGLIGANGKKNKWYDYAQDANEWIAFVDGILMNAENKDVIVCGDSAKTNTKTGTFSFRSDSYQNIVTVSGDEAVVGVFEYNGKMAYYVVNYNYSSTEQEETTAPEGYNSKRSASETITTDEITLTFDEDKTVTVYNSNGCKKEAKDTSSKAITVSVEQGGAALVIVD